MIFHVYFPEESCSYRHNMLVYLCFGGHWAVNVFKIKDSYLVLRGNKILPEERVRAQNLMFESYEAVNGATYKSFDVEKSLLLGIELPVSEYSFSPKEYRNELRDFSEQQNVMRRNADYVFVHPNFKVHDDDVPEMIKKLGIKLYNKCDIYKLKYDDKSQSFGLTDEKGRPCGRRGLNAETDRNSITMYTEMYGFEKSDYLRLRKVYAYVKNNNKSEEKRRIDSLSARDKALLEIWSFVQERVDKDKKQKPYTLRHEIIHIRNRYIMNQHNLSKNRGRLSTEDYFRLGQYDEKSAHLAENLLAIKNYVVKGDYNDFSMFPEKSEWLVERLKSLPEEKRKIELRNYKMIVTGTFKYWDLVHTKGYMLQFANIVNNWARKSPVSFMGDDEEEYKKRRKDILTNRVIDPITKQEVIVDFSQFIEQDILITPEIKKVIIDPANKKIEERKEKLRKSGMTKSEIKKVQEYHWRDNVGKFQIKGRDDR